MRTPLILITIGLVAALATGGLASPHEQGAEARSAAAAASGAHADERSAWGVCRAWENNAQGREHGNVTEAAAFRWLHAQAENAGVEAYCALVAHPSAGRGPPAHAEHAGNASAAESARAENATRGPPSHAPAAGDGPPYGKGADPARAQAYGRGDERPRGDALPADD